MAIYILSSDVDGGGANALEQRLRTVVPNLIRIRSVYFQIRMGNALWLALELVLRLAMRLTANNLSFAGVLNAYLRPNKREEAQHKNAGPDT